MDNSNPFQSPTVDAPTPDVARLNRRVFPRVVAVLDAIGILGMLGVFGLGFYEFTPAASGRRLPLEWHHFVSLISMLFVVVLGFTADVGLRRNKSWAFRVGCVALAPVAVDTAVWMWFVSGRINSFEKMPLNFLATYAVLVIIRPLWLLVYAFALRAQYRSDQSIDVPRFPNLLLVPRSPKRPPRRT